jgi:dysferlin
MKGKRKLPHLSFETPDGWEWEGDWFVNPDKSAADKTASSGHVSQDEIFEYQFREPYSSFDKSTSLWRNCENEELGEGITKETFDLPKGWEWISEWSYDINRAVSELGWEYTSDAADGPWTPVEKVMHVCRRRRWVRTRKLVEEPEPEKVRYLHSF